MTQIGEDHVDPIESLVAGLRTAFVVVLIATAIVLPLDCLFLFVPLWLVTKADLSIPILTVSASLYVLILNGGVSGTLVWILRRRKRRLDAAFTPLGLEVERYLLTRRQSGFARSGDLAQQRESCVKESCLVS